MEWISDKCVRIHSMEVSMSDNIIQWDFMRSRKRKERGLAPEKIELEKVVIPENWNAGQYEKFRDILELLCGIDEEYLPLVWSTNKGLVSTRHSCNCEVRYSAFDEL